MQSPIKSRSPEDVELSRKREELADLQARLAELELQLLTLRLELTDFEALYHSKAGALYAELDEVEALIADVSHSFGHSIRRRRKPPLMLENERTIPIGLPTNLPEHCHRLSNARNV